MAEFDVIFFLFKMINSKSFILVIILFLVVAAVSVEKWGSRREKRTLVWPPGSSKLLVICGFGIPVDITPETVIVGVVIKGNYPYPTNATQITDPFATIARKKRGLNRWDLYALLSDALEMKGFSGKSCLLRTICEVAHSPLVKNLGLYHELIHMFFTPFSTKEKINHHSDNEYYAAQIFGQQRRSCDLIFKDCTVSLSNVFSVLEGSL